MDSDPVQRLFEDGGELLAVRARQVGSGQIAELAFDFPTGTLHCRCNVDTDEIIIEVVDAASLDYSVIRDEALAGLRGMSVSDAWLMTNDRGYTDALQLRFMDTEGREETRQFEVAASTISLRLVVDQR